MSALSTKRSLEIIAGLSIDGSGLSGADLEQAALVAQSNVPALAAGMDGARLDQMDWRGVKDDFNRPNSLLVGSSPKNVSRAWVGSGTTSGINITTNTCVYDGVATGYAGVDSTLFDNYALRAKITAITANGPRFLVRATSIATSSGFLVIRDQPANTWALSDDNGGGTVSSFADAVDLVANDVVVLEVRGDNITVIVNGVTRGVLTGAATKYTTGSIQGFKTIAANGFTLDDFYIYGIA